MPSVRICQVNNFFQHFHLLKSNITIKLSLVGEEGEARGRLVPVAQADKGLGGGQLADCALHVSL